MTAEYVLRDDSTMELIGERDEHWTVTFCYKGSTGLTAFQEPLHFIQWEDVLDVIRLSSAAAEVKILRKNAIYKHPRPTSEVPAVMTTAAPSGLPRLNGWALDGHKPETD